jgi:hypothetical protein
MNNITQIAQTINTQLDELLIAHGVSKNVFFATRFFVTRKVCQLNARYLKRQEDSVWDGVIDLYREAIGSIDSFLNLYESDDIATAQRYIDPVIGLAAKMVQDQFGEECLGQLDMVLRELVQINNLHTYKVMTKELGQEGANAIVAPMQRGFATAVNAELAIANA